MLAIASLLFATPARADALSRWRPLVEQAAARCGIPIDWIERVMRAESAGMTTLNGRPIVSRAGAMGLMQLMPGTWADMRASLGLGPDPHDPRDNIVAGACYLRMMYDRFGYPGLFAAYNAGPARYAATLASGRPLPAETQAYIVAVGVGQRAANPAGRGTPKPSIFFALKASASTEDRLQSKPATGLFVVLSGNLARD
ncbi:MAG: lytic transglycosylase domain-containing protein [Methylocella sp.]